MPYGFFKFASAFFWDNLCIVLYIFSLSVFQDRVQQDGILLIKHTTLDLRAIQTNNVESSSQSLTLKYDISSRAYVALDEGHFQTLLLSWSSALNINIDIYLTFLIVYKLDIDFGIHFQSSKIILDHANPALWVPKAWPMDADNMTYGFRKHDLWMPKAWPMFHPLVRCAIRTSNWSKSLCSESLFRICIYLRQRYNAVNRCRSLHLLI